MPDGAVPLHSGAGAGMAQLSLGEGRWRMLRRVIRKKRFTYADARNQTRHDQTHFDWLLAHGLFEAAGEGVYAVTAVGRAAADLGLYDWEPAVGPRSARNKW